MVRHDQLSERVGPAQHDVTRFLTANCESGAPECVDALTARHARQLRQTAITMVSNGSAGTGRLSSSSARTYSRIASRAFATAYSRVFPCETQPGRLGHSATQ